MADVGVGPLRDEFVVFLDGRVQAPIRGERAARPDGNDQAAEREDVRGDRDRGREREQGPAPDPADPDVRDARERDESDDEDEKAPSLIQFPLGRQLPVHRHRDQIHEEHRIAVHNELPAGREGDHEGVVGRLAPFVEANKTGRCRRPVCCSF